MILKIPYIVVLGICAFVAIFYRKILLQRLPNIYYLIIITFPVELFADLYLRFTNQIPKFIYWFFIPIEYFFLARYYVSIIDNKNIKKSINASIAILFILRISYSIYINDYYINTSLFSNITTLFIILWCIFYFRQILNFEQTTPFFKNSNILICLGVLVFNVGSLFIISMINHIYAFDKNLAMGLWNIALLLNIIMYSFIIYAFRCQVLNHNS